MCFGGGGKQSVPTVQAPPTPAPAPTITPSDVSPQANDESRRKRLEKLRYGLQSTIKTSSRGITGSGPDLSSAGLMGKDKLGK